MEVRGGFREYAIGPVVACTGSKQESFMQRISSLALAACTSLGVAAQSVPRAEEPDATVFLRRLSAGAGARGSWASRRSRERRREMRYSGGL